MRMRNQATVRQKPPGQTLNAEAPCIALEAQYARGWTPKGFGSPAPVALLIVGHAADLTCGSNMHLPDRNSVAAPTHSCLTLPYLGLSAVSVPCYNRSLPGPPHCLRLSLKSGWRPPFLHGYVGLCLYSYSLELYTDV